MITEQQIYCFEKVLSDALSSIFTDEQLMTFTFQSAPTFEKDLFRVEAVTEFTGSTGLLYAGSGLGSRPGDTHELMRNGRAKITVYSQPDVDMQDAVIARIRRISATIIPVANAILPYHALEWFSDAGCEYSRDASQGYYGTSLNYDFQFAIKPDAMTAFLTQQ